MFETTTKQNILDALNHLYDLNSMVYDYWLSVLFDEEEQEVSEQWNLQTLYEMEKDVMFHTKEQ